MTFNDMKKFELTYDELLELLKKSYHYGYASYELIEAGLEPYDADGSARWTIYMYEQKKKDG